MITGDQLLCHAVGDYVLQSDWMANNKTRRSVAALAHAVTYALPFLLLHPSATAVVVIVSTHFVIDRWRLARYVVWAKNAFLAPDGPPIPQLIRGTHRLSWQNCQHTGYSASTPPWLATWLMIIADNVLHVAINGLALKYLP